MSDPTFGISIIRQDEGPLPGVKADMSIVGLVFTAPDADAGVFPLDTPVLFFSSDAAKLTAMGEDGTGYRAVSLINEQLGEFQVSATIVGVRVEEGATTTETIANLRGDVNTRTGMFALLDAPALLGVTPRIICVPGYTSQPTNGVASVAVTAGGSGYTSAPTVAFSGGGGSGAEGTAVLGSGADAGKVVSVTITNPGSGYTSAPTVAFSGGAGTGATATATVDSTANGVIASLPTLLDRLLAVAVVDGPSSSAVAEIAWRETLSSDRLIPAPYAVKVMDDTGAAVTTPASPAVVGIAVRVDHEHGGPWRSWANQPVRGIVGTARPVDFSILDGSTEGQLLLSNNLGVIVRGENTDGAIASGGFVYIGTDNVGDDPVWQFYHQMRIRDYIHLMFVKTLRSYLGRRNITRGTIEDILATMEFALRDVKADGGLLGYRVSFQAEGNSPEQLRLGRVKVAFQAEEPPVLRRISISSGRYRDALDDLLADLQSRFDIAA